jgi:hypothetical protein
MTSRVCVSTRTIPFQKNVLENSLEVLIGGGRCGMRQKVERIYSLPTVQPGDIQNVDRYLISGTRNKKT